jgi:hypothetical protein
LLDCVRPEQAINWSQAGGSMKAEGAGVWWASMPLGERMTYKISWNTKTLLKNDGLLILVTV